MLNKLKKREQKTVKKMLGTSLTAEKIDNSRMLVKYLKPSELFNTYFTNYEKHTVDIALNSFFAKGLNWHIKRQNNAWHILCSLLFNQIDPITNDHFLLLIANNHTRHLVNIANEFGNTPLQHFLLSMYYLYNPKFTFNPARIVRAMLSSGEGAELFDMVKDAKMQEGFKQIFNKNKSIAATHIFLGLAAKYYKLFTHQYYRERSPLFNVIIRSTKSANKKFQEHYTQDEVNVHNALKITFNWQYGDYQGAASTLKSSLRSELLLVCKIVSLSKVPENFVISDYFEIFKISYRSIMNHMINDEMSFSEPDKIKYCSYSIMKLVIDDAKKKTSAEQILHNAFKRALELDVLYILPSCVELGANINYIYPNGDTFLIICAKEQSTDCLNVLLKNKKDDKRYLNSQDKDGRTALMWCTISNFQRGAVLLCKNKLVNPLIKDNLGKDFYSYQEANGSLNSLQATTARAKAKVKRATTNVAKLLSNKEKQDESNKEFGY